MPHLQLWTNIASDIDFHPKMMAEIYWSNRGYPRINQRRVFRNFFASLFHHFSHDFFGHEVGYSPCLIKDKNHIKLIIAFISLFMDDFPLRIPMMYWFNHDDPLFIQLLVLTLFELDHQRFFRWAVRSIQSPHRVNQVINGTTTTGERPVFESLGRWKYTG